MLGQEADVVYALIHDGMARGPAMDKPLRVKCGKASWDSSHAARPSFVRRHLSFQILGIRVGVQCYGTEAAELLQRNFEAMRFEGTEFDIRYVVTKDGQGAFFIRREAEEPFVVADAGMFLYAFEKDLMIQLQLLRCGLYFVHSAVLEYQGMAYLLTGPSGNGKSTLSWALMHHGFRYASDELAPINPSTGLVYAYMRALCLKRSPSPPYELPAGILHTSRTLHIPAELLPIATSTSLPIKGIFFLQYSPEDNAPSVRPASAAEVATRLYANGLNVLAHPDNGLEAAVHIASAITSAFVIRTKDLSTTAALITSLVEQAANGC